jgi:hypothetical protein
MDEAHEHHLTRIMQNRRDRGVSVNPGAAAVPPAPSVPPPARSGATGLREASPMARFPSSVRNMEPPLQSSTVPSLSYGGGAVGGPSRSSSLMYAEPPPTSRPPPSQPQYTSTNGSYNPTAAAYENAVPGQLGGRGGSMVSMAPGPQTSSGNAMMRAPSVDALLRRGTFDNFRSNPVFVSSNIRPYSAASPQQGAAPVSPATPAAEGNAVQRSSMPLQHKSPNYVPAAKPSSPKQDQLGGHHPTSNSQRMQQPQPQSQAPPTMNAVAAATFSKPNPFRSQTFEDYCEAPHYDRNVSYDVVVPQHQRQGERNPKRLLAMSQQQSDGGPPIYDPQHSLSVLCQGDWFLKWTRIESAHRRYVWLDLNRGVLSWAKSRDSSFFLQKSVKLEEIMDLQPLCTVDETTSRSFYQLLIVSTERTLKIGTEMRDKFDVWFDTLQRLCEAQRVYTNTFIGRHAASNRSKMPHDFARRPAGDADGTE